MKNDLRRYELFGWDYIQHNPLKKEEIDWYLKYAKQTGGPVLELACGTGRLLIEIAKKEFNIVGIDLSNAMLKIAKSKVDQLKRRTQNRIKLFKKNMIDFKLKQKFNLIYIADNSFRVIFARKQQLRCLKNIYNHLNPEGKFLMAERRFNPDSYPGGKRIFSGWSAPITNPETGETIQRTGYIKIIKNGKCITGKFIYKLIKPNGKEKIIELPFTAPIILTKDYMSLLKEAGFKVDIYKDYKQQRDDGKSNFLCFVCRKF